MEYIYTISCPFTGHVVYVGKSKHPEKRLKEHCKLNTTYMVSLIHLWCVAIISIKQYPVMKIIDDNNGGHDIFYIENKWIGYYKSIGQANHNRYHAGRNCTIEFWYKKPLSLQIQDLKSIEAIKMTISPFKRLTPQQQEK